MFHWYVINTYSGHENKVKANLEHRIESMNQRSRFRRVVVPTEQVIETKDGLFLALSRAELIQVPRRALPSAAAFADLAGQVRTKVAASIAGP